MAIMKEDKSIHLYNYHTQQHAVQNFYKNEKILLQKSLKPFHVATTYRGTEEMATSYAEEEIYLCCYRTGDNNYKLYILQVQNIINICTLCKYHKQFNNCILALLFLRQPNIITIQVSSSN